MENLFDDDDDDLDEKCVTLANIKDMLPDWDSKIVELHHYKNGIGYEIVFLIPANTELEAKQWIREYETLTKCSYSIRSTEKCSGSRVNFKQRLNCRHNTGASTTYTPCPSLQRKRTRNTNCPSQIIVTLRAIKKKYKGKDQSKAPDPKYPCEIRLNPVHNHSVRTAEALRFRAVTDETKQQLFRLFEADHSAATALEIIKIDIELKYDNCHEVLVDRAVCPNYMYCYNLYVNHFKPKFKPPKMEEYLTRRIELYNQADENSARVTFIDSEYVITVCSALMKRVHMHIENAANIVYVDSAGTVYDDGSRTFILSTATECGCIPLAFIIISSESADLLVIGFQLLQEIMGTTIFGGCVDGPTMFMTEDSLCEQSALQRVWPSSKCLLSTFHALQAVWRWLISSKNRIQESDQQIFFQQFRTIMYASNLSECEDAYEDAYESSKKYPLYHTFLEDYWKHKDMWTLSSRNHETNEAALRLLKEQIFERIRAFNILQTIDFMLTKFVCYYERLLLDATTITARENILQQSTEMPPLGIFMQIRHITNYIYLVPNGSASQDTYVINSEVLTCTCQHGHTGYICKHINWVCLFVQTKEFIKLINSETVRRKLYFIATGKQSELKSIEVQGQTVHSTPIIDEKYYNKLMEEGMRIMNDINDGFMDYLNKSPENAIKALDTLNVGLRNIKTVAGFTTACRAFSGSSNSGK